MLGGTDLGRGRGLCTSAQSRPEWAAWPTWWGRTYQPRNSRKPGRRAGWGLREVRGTEIERRQWRTETRGGSCIIKYEFKPHKSSDKRLLISLIFTPLCDPSERNHFGSGATMRLAANKSFIPRKTPSVSNHTRIGDDTAVLRASKALFIQSRVVGGGLGGLEGRATVMETSDSKWFSTIQPAQHGCPLGWHTHTHTKRMDPSASCCTTPFLSFLSNSIPQCTCLVRERERKRREGIPFDLDRHANAGGHATAMEHPTAQQHRGPGSLTACANL